MSMTPLEKITKELAKGSRSELARILGVHRSTVSGWNNPERRAKGMCGTVPEKYVATVLQVAAARGVTLGVQDLLHLAEK